MTFSTGAIAERTMSALPLSVGTSLAFETLFAPMQAPYDPERVVPEKVDLSTYDSLYVNLLTLHRNLIGSLPKGGEDRVMPGDLADALEFEVDLIKRQAQETTFGKTKVVFYASSYKNLPRHHPHGKLRENKTDKQFQYHRLLETTLQTFIKEQVKSDSIVLFDRKLEPKHRDKTLILTHYAYDLLSRPKFEDLTLLESHTGVVKTPALWYTKLTGGKDLVKIPFNSATIQIFGDSQTFLAQPQKFREQVLALANQYNWTHTTTVDRLRFCATQMADQFAGTTFAKMLSE